MTSVCQYSHHQDMAEAVAYQNGGDGALALVRANAESRSTFDAIFAKSTG